MIDLQRFLDAQENTYARALEELRNGHKKTHWIWWIFPQPRDLGRSERARHYGIDSFAEAEAYLQHVLLGHRLHTAVEQILWTQENLGYSIEEILESQIDVIKFRSSMSLFREVASRLDNLASWALFDAAYAASYDGLVPITTHKLSEVS